MVPYTSRANRPPDPIRDHVVEVRRGLLRLHKTLVDAERAVYERRRGAMSNGQFLQALLTDPYFAWIRPFSGLVVEIDEALAADEPLTHPSARQYMTRVRTLLTPQGEAAARYDEVRLRDPDVLVAHVELVRRLTAASEAGL